MQMYVYLSVCVRTSITSTKRLEHGDEHEASIHQHGRVHDEVLLLRHVERLLEEPRRRVRAPERAHTGQQEARNTEILHRNHDVDGCQANDRQQAVAEHRAHSVDVDRPLRRQQVHQQVHEQTRQHSEAVNVPEVNLGSLQQSIKIKK